MRIVVSVSDGGDIAIITDGIDLEVVIVDNKKTRRYAPTLDEELIDLVYTEADKGS